MNAIAIGRCGVAAALVSLAVACTDTPVAPEPPDAAPVVTQLASTVMRSGVDSIAIRADLLRAALDLLAGTRTETTLAASRVAWLASRDAWERSEAYTFGPATTGGYDGRMDTWPIDLTGLTSVIAGTAPLTDSSVALLNDEVLGFHAIEYVLWGEGGVRTAASLSLRETAFLRAAGRKLSADAAALRRQWAADGGDYAGELIRAGGANSRYSSQAAALQEIVSGMLGSVTEVATSKMAQPLVSRDVVFSESRFSDNSLNDFRNNILSVRDVYNGGRTAAGGGVSALMMALDPAGDREILRAFDTTIAALNTVQPSFGKVLLSSPATIESAQRAVLALSEVLGRRLGAVTGAVDRGT
jgi:putative iron-regulated protein